jgi:hypothetical protein
MAKKLESTGTSLGVSGNVAEKSKETVKETEAGPGAVVTGKDHERQFQESDNLLAGPRRSLEHEGLTKSTEEGLEKPVGKAGNETTQKVPDAGFFGLAEVIGRVAEAAEKAMKAGDTTAHAAINAVHVSLGDLHVRVLAGKDHLMKYLKIKD